MSDHGIDPRTRAGDGAVDAFMCQQQRAGDAVRLAQLQQRRAEGLVVVETGEVIKSADCKHGPPITPILVSYQDHLTVAH